MTEVDSQCLRKGTTRMPQKILKQLLQTARQGNGTGAALCVYPLVITDRSTVKIVYLEMLAYRRYVQ